MTATIFTEIKGTVAKFRALAKKHDFKYVVGDRIFRRTHGKEVTIRAFRTIYPGKTSSATIHVQRGGFKRPAKRKTVVKKRKRTRA